MADWVSLHCQDLHATSFYIIATDPRNYHWPAFARRSRPATWTVLIIREKYRAGHLPPYPAPDLIQSTTCFFLHVLLDGNLEGGQDLYIFKIVINGGIQGMLAQTSNPACTIPDVNQIW